MFNLRYQKTFKISTMKCTCSLKIEFIRRVRGVLCVDCKNRAADSAHGQVQRRQAVPVYFVDTLVLLFQEKFAP